MENPIKIIVAEDQPTWRQKLREELLPYNITVIAEAQNGLELIKLLKTHNPDVVLLDLAMPIMDGNETMSYLNLTYPEIKVIIISLFDEPVLMEDYVMRNIKGCVSKTEASGSIDGLATAIKKVCKGGKHFNFATEKEIVEFSIRQKEIINQISKGKTQKEIADELGITISAVDKQKKKIMKITGVSNISQLYSYIFERGLQFFRKPKGR